MKASELRIGNYVKVLIDGEEIIRKITGINDVDNENMLDGYSSPFIRYFDGSIILNDDEDDFVLPIPLSPEILEKCGFVKKGRYAIGVGGYQVFVNGRIELLQPKKGGPYILAFHEVKIAYLHQLQNLYFALTGEELTITF